MPHGARSALLALLLRGAAAAARTPTSSATRSCKAVIAKAIAQAQCFTDQYDSAVWYTLMEPRLRTLVEGKGRAARHPQAGVLRDPPLAVKHGCRRDWSWRSSTVESRFDRWAVSSAGAVGLMQVMPFWPERLGMRRYELVHVAPNIHMGCAILRFYLGYEHNDVRRRSRATTAASAGATTRTWCSAAGRAGTAPTTWASPGRPARTDRARTRA